MTPFALVYFSHRPLSGFSHQVYTIDRLAQTIVRQLQLLIEESSLDVLGAYERKLCEPGMAYREHVLELVDDSKALYKLSHQTARNVIRVQMIDLAEPEPDLKLQDPSVRPLRPFFPSFFRPSSFFY